MPMSFQNSSKFLLNELTDAASTTDRVWPGGGSSSSSYGSSRCYVQEVSVRLHDDMEAVEEKRARYEEELDRVNDMLTESESRRQALQKEVDLLIEQASVHSVQGIDPGSWGVLSPLKICRMGQIMF